MNVLLVNPIIPAEKVNHMVPPLGLGYLATALRDKHTVKILDCVKENMSFNRFRYYLLKTKPDIVGITFYSYNYVLVKKSLTLIKEVDSSTTTIVGGPHPSAIPEETLSSFPEIDFAFAGEGESGLPLLIDRISSNGRGSCKLLEDIPGLVYRDNQEIMRNSPVHPEDLDALGMPSWDLIHPQEYPPAPNGFFYKDYPLAPIVVTRGCPFPCNFCAARTVTGKRMRSRSVDNVIEEIKILTQRYGIKEIYIEDDNFTYDKNFVQNLCKRIIEDRLKVHFSCPNGVRLDSLDEETLLLMKKAGWYSLYAGIESGSQRILDKMGKNLTIGEIREKVSLIKRAGLEVSAFFIIGYPEETKEEIDKSINFACELDLNWVDFSYFIPLPGTAIFDALKAKGELIHLDWDRCFGSEVAYISRDIPYRKLRRQKCRAFLRFYCRPKIIWQFIRKLRCYNLKFLVRNLLLIIKNR